MLCAIVAATKRSVWSFRQQPAGNRHAELSCRSVLAPKSAPESRQKVPEGILNAGSRQGGGREARCRLRVSRSLAQPVSWRPRPRTGWRAPSCPASAWRNLLGSSPVLVAATRGRFKNLGLAPAAGRHRSWHSRLGGKPRQGNNARRGGSDG